MALSAPTSFEPLASSNPVPADTDAITSLGKKYNDTAAMIEQQANDLKQLSNSSASAWKSQAGSVFTSKASDLSTRITQAEQRYKTAGAALTAAAGPMYDAQQQAYAAVQQAQEAEQTMKANAPAPPPAPGSPPLTDDQKAAAAAAAKNYSAAQDSLAQAQSQFNSAVEAYQTAAQNAANQINNELNGDPLKDSWFQQHFGWLTEFFKILGYVLMALAIIAVIIACPATAGLLGMLGVSAGALATVGTVVDVLTVALTALSAINDLVQGIDGNGWTAFGLDILGLASFGLGKVVEGIAESTVKGATAIAGHAEGVKAGVSAGVDAASKARDSAAAAASKATYDSLSQDDAWAAKIAHNNAVASDPALAGDKAFTFSLNDLNDAVAKAGKDAYAGATDAANAAAKAASAAASKAAAEAITKLSENAKATGLAGNAVGFWTMSSDLAKDLASLNAVADKVPNIAQVGSAITKVKALSVGIGAVQWGSFSGGAWSFGQLVTGG